MNAKQRNKNRETAANLRYSLMVWNSRNRRMEMPKTEHDRVSYELQIRRAQRERSQVQ